MDMEQAGLGLLVRALVQNEVLVAGVQPQQLDAPTPCEGWSVTMLLGHIVGGLRFSAFNVRHEQMRKPPAPYADGEWLRAYREASADLLQAWNRPGALGETYSTPFGEAGAGVVLDMLVMEAAVHGWDLAKATDQLDELVPELAEAMLAMAHTMVPADRRGGKSPFGPVVAIASDADAYSRLVAFLGRQP